MGIIEGIGAAVGGVLGKAQDLRSAITGEITPDKQAEIVIRAQEIEAELLKAQADINKAAATSNIGFVAGARPAFLWVCVFAVGFHYILRPLVSWALAIGQVDVVLPVIDISELWPALMGVLGLGAYRTFEKIKGVQDKH